MFSVPGASPGDNQSGNAGPGASHGDNQSGNAGPQDLGGLRSPLELKTLRPEICCC